MEKGMGWACLRPLQKFLRALMTKKKRGGEGERRKGWVGLAAGPLQKFLRAPMTKTISNIQSSYF